jgi:HAMP domain-containing protein
MNHLPFIVGAYAAGILIPAAFALDAWRRMGGAARRLAAIGQRKGR